MGKKIVYNPTKPYTHRISNLVKKTWQIPELRIVGEIPYTTFMNNSFFYQVDHVDGLGTKGRFHWQARTFKEAVQDVLAMNINDLLLVRARPYKLQDHITLPKDDHEAIIEIVEALCNESYKRKIAVTGGETSIHHAGDFDISISMSGIIKKLHKNKFKIGDVLMGLPSNGLHSNGFTLAAKFLTHNNEFMKPTKIYDEIVDIDKKHGIHGMMHITGGAYTKLLPLLNHADAEIVGFETQNIFRELAKHLTDREMYQTFNCGIGFVFSVDSEVAETIAGEFDARVIGRIVPGSGKVNLESVFTGEIVKF
jgi:phosphoribosylformylglycinamidine cyclo-ligase